MEVSSVTATLFLSSVPNCTLATDTCGCGSVLLFPRCVVRVLALGIHTAKPHLRSVERFALVCVSGSLRDGPGCETARTLT